MAALIIITGWHSEIAIKFRELLPAEEYTERGSTLLGDMFLDADQYLFCQGLLRPKKVGEQTPLERKEGVDVNYKTIARECDAILAENDRARICIIGSESGYRGSYDGVYARAKADLHAYIEGKELRTPHQQIVGISPDIIDCGMTKRRADKDNVRRRRAEHPKKRFIKPEEVAYLAYHLLYGPLDYVSGTVIRMHGGRK